MASGDSLHVFKPGGADFLSSIAAPFSSIAAATGRRNLLLYDDTADEEAIWSSVLNRAYDGGGLTVDVYGSMDQANTSDFLVLQAAIERIQVGDAQGSGGNDFAALQGSGQITADDQADDLFKGTITFTSGAQMDSLLKGEPFRFKLRRDADSTSATDDALGDFQMSRVEIRET